jgi:hypothetical protein
MRRRKRAVLTGPAAELAGYAAACHAAAGRGDQEAAARLPAVRSWQDMLRLSGDDPDIGALFVAFAEDDFVLSRLRRGAG